MAANELIRRAQAERMRALVHTPTFLVVAGSLPGLHAATSAVDGLAIGIVSAVSILAMAALARPLRAVTGRFTYIPVTLMVSATGPRRRPPAGGGGDGVPERPESGRAP